MNDKTPKMPTQADIAERAYQHFERRNWEHGHHLTDWVNAEKELQAEYLENLKAMKPLDARPASTEPEAKQPDIKGKAQSA